MTICGLSLHHGNKKERKNLKQKLIFQLGTLSPHGINMNACLSINYSQIHVTMFPPIRTSRTSRKNFGAEKPFVKLRPTYCVKLDFSYVVKGWKIKITMKFLASNHLRLEDTRWIMSPKKFRDFRETGTWQIRSASSQADKGNAP